MSLSSETFAVLPNVPGSSAAIIHRPRQLDESAFTEVFERHRHMIYRVCLRYVGHHHDAEDITQETFRRAAIAMPSVDSQRPLEPWLVTIAANRCRSFLSRNQHNRRVNSLHDVCVPCGDEPDSARQLSLSEQLDLALDRLPADQRRAFELVHQQELSYPEAARAMGRPLGTVKTWVRRAKLGMQDTLLAADDSGAPAPTNATCSNDTPPVAANAGEEAATRRSMGLRKGAAALVASVVVVGFLGIAGRSEPEISATVANDGFPGSIPATVFAAPDHAPERLDQPGDLSETDWQWVSLNAFLRARLDVNDVEALPLGQWMLQTTPTLDQLRSTIKPLESTLHRVAELFQCELAQIDSPAPLTRGPSQLDNATEDHSATNAALREERGTSAALMSPSLGSIS
mgnify:CR=1 FL=1